MLLSACKLLNYCPSRVRRSVLAALPAMLDRYLVCQRRGDNAVGILSDLRRQVVMIVLRVCCWVKYKVKEARQGR